jgi:hypothetical protein
MKLAVQIIAYGAMLMGVFAILGGFATGTGELDNYAIFGGLLFFISGLMPIIYLYQEDHK